MNNLFEVRGQVVLITGGAQGLGHMIAEGFVKAGATVYITSRKTDVVEQSAAELRRFGACIGIAADLSTPEAAVALAAEVQRRESRLHVLVNNAGKTWGAPLASFPDKAWTSIMAVNVQGPFTLVRELLPLLKAAATADAPARVINIGSLAGLRVQRLSAFSYAASKAAMHHLSRELAAELGADHITVNTIVPGYFPTQMTAHIRQDADEHQKLLDQVPLHRLGEADDIVGACIFLASRAGRYMTGTELVLDGGLAGCG